MRVLCPDDRTRRFDVTSPRPAADGSLKGSVRLLIMPGVRAWVRVSGVVRLVNGIWTFTPHPDAQHAQAFSRKNYVIPEKRRNRHKENSSGTLFETRS